MSTDTLAHLVDEAAKRWPDKDAWIFDATGERLTFADIRRRSGALASALAELGARPGDRVAVMLRNVPEFGLLWLALGRLGAVLVPVNTNYRELDGEHVLAHSGARFVVTSDEFSVLLKTIQPRTSVERVLTVGELTGGEHPVPEPAALPESPANLQYTSGTTGAPKGCVLPHRYWTTIAHDLATAFPSVSEDDVLLTAQPFHYIDPQWNVALGLRSGATLVVLDRFHPSVFWDRVRDYDVTWFYCLGLMPTALLRLPPSPADTAHRVRAIHASAIPPELHAELERRWGVPWYEAFGMTETGSDIRVDPRDHDALVGTGCIGTPVAHREVIVADENDVPVPRGETGALLIRGTGLMHGYHGDPQATERAFRGGWFHTGDLARMDDAGRVFYEGRTKDMIRRSGENISAAEVEAALMRHPAVRLAAVLPVPDPLRGEEVKAYLVPAGRERPELAELAEYCKTKLAYFKVPRYWTYVDELPMTPSERVAKGELRKASDDLRRDAYDAKEKTWR